MKLIKRVGWEALVMEAMAPEPYGPGFSEDEVLGADVLEIWAPDEGWGTYLEYRLLSQDKVQCVKRTNPR